MSPRGAIEALLDLREMDGGNEHLGPDKLDAMAVALLADLCSDLAICLAGAEGRSMHRRDARERAAEQAAAIHTVLAAWELAGVEVVDGPRLDGCPLGPPRRE